MLFEMPKTWWSRPYEYEWARQFCKPGQVVLDAACGVSHPFKFYLADVCREVHACDLDTRIMAPDRILADIANDFGEQVAKGFPRRYLMQVEFAVASITELPYRDRKFDRVFCVSVLEHLTPEDQVKTLIEFKRVLRDDGLIVVTVDYPTVNLQLIQQTVQANGLEFAGRVNFEQPSDAIFDSQWGKLYVCRFVLRKRQA